MANQQQLHTTQLITSNNTTGEKIILVKNTKKKLRKTSAGIWRNKICNEFFFKINLKNSASHWLLLQELRIDNKM